jgi:hypothetical protein
VSSRRWGAVGIVGLTLLCAASVRAQDVRGRLSVLGQVREGDQSRETEAPSYLYGDLGIDRLRHGTELGTVFQLGRDFGADDGTSDFYAGFVRVPAVTPGLDITLGRQFLSEGPDSIFVADGGKIRFDPGWPVAFSLYGGRPRYFEPTFGSNIIDEDEWLFGGSVSAARWRGGELTLGYQQYERSGDVLRQSVTGTAGTSFTSLPGVPRLYGSVSYDADRQNLDLATGGVNFVFAPIKLQWNAEGTYYKPQDHDRDRPTFDLNRREDPIFELFSIDEMRQARTGFRYTVFSNLFALIDYSFQHYNHIEGQRENSHIASAGLLWLPGGDGLEVARGEYYVVDSDGGRVNGVKASYESYVYERLVYRSKIDVLSYDKENNQGGTAVNGLLGLGFVLLPKLICELYFEANHNDHFDEDFRFGFSIDYNFRHPLRGAPSAAAPSAAAPSAAAPSAAAPAAGQPS